MYRIDTGCKTINGERVDTFIRGIVGKNSLMEAEAGTNGNCGDDSRVYLRLTVLNKANFYARVKTKGKKEKADIQDTFGGTEGVDAALKALKFAKRVLTDQLVGEVG